MRPLVVISIVDQVKKKGDYHLQVSDIKTWEKENGRIPEGSVVMVRSDWSKKWTTDAVKAKALAADPVFPGVGLNAIKYLHLQRKILFHGHEPLDTDTTPTLEGEYWLMHNGYTQAEGVDNLDAVPETGCLINIGYPKFGGGLGGYARYIAICPPDTKGAKDLLRRRAAEEEQQAPALRRDRGDADPLASSRATPRRSARRGTAPGPGSTAPSL